LSLNTESLEVECLVGHVYSPATLLQAHYETQERTLWAAVVVLEEAAELVEALAPRYPAATVDRLREQAAIKGEHAKQIRKLLEALEPFRAD